MSYFDFYKNTSQVVVDSKKQRPRKSADLIAPPARYSPSENKSFNLVLSPIPEESVDPCVDDQKILEIEEIKENDGVVVQRPTSRFRKALSHVFEDLEDYHFLKNEAYTLGTLMPIRNFYHYFRQFKSERSEEILKRINRQTSSLPPLTQEDFGELFKYFLSYSEVDKDQGWQLDQQVIDHLKITRSDCQELRKKNKKFIDEIISNKNYDQIYRDFIGKNASLDKKKIFLENLIAAHHIKEQQEFYRGDVEHYSVDETYRRVEDSLKNFNKEKIKEKLAYLTKINQQITELSFYTNEEKKIYTAWSSFVSSHAWIKNLNTFFVQIPLELKKTPILYGLWALILSLIVLMIYFLLAVFSTKKEPGFGEESILLAEVNEKTRIENVLQKITSRRFHYQQMLFLTKEKKVIDLFGSQKRENEKNWTEFSHCFSALLKQIYLVNKTDLERDSFSEEELARRKCQSMVYHYVSDVNQDTQFWLIVVSKGINSIVCAGLFISCASLVLLELASLSGCALWATGLAAAIASPYIFIALVATIFIILLHNHYISTCKREQSYQQAITYHLDKKCEYHYCNEQGEWCVREVAQWQKFEYLRKDIELLEKYVRDTLETSEENLLSENYKKVLDEFLNREGIFEYHRRDKALEEFRSKRSRFDYFLIRAMVFLTGGMYGFSLQYTLGNHFCTKLIIGATLPFLVLVFLPLSIVSGIINLLVYSLHKKQEKKLFFLKHFDAKLSSLEDRKDSLLCVIATLDTLKKQQESPQQEGLLEDKKAISEQDTVSPFMRDTERIDYRGSPIEFFNHALGKEVMDNASKERITTEAEDALPLRLSFD